MPQLASLPEKSADRPHIPFDYGHERSMHAVHNGLGANGMANEFETKIIYDFAQNIAGKLSEAAIIAKAASGLGAEGLTERAFQTLLDIKPLINEASVLLNATSVVRRRDYEQDVGFG